MRTIRLTIVATLAAAGAFCLVDEARAGFTVIGPTPYLSRADSPFDVDAPSARFWVEDFEDEVPAPGLWQDPQWEVLRDLGFDPTLSRVAGNSVDADDGAIDDSGDNGFSAGLTGFSNVGFTGSVFARFHFDSDALEGYPTFVGVVITGESAEFNDDGSMTLLAANGEEFAYRLDQLTSFNGETSDDRFIGFTNPNGISSVWIGNSSLIRGLARLRPFDHFQYGFAVPEPLSLNTLLLGVLPVALFRRKQ